MAKKKKRFSTKTDPEYQIKTKSWKKYTSTLKRLSDTASNQLKEYILEGHTESEILEVAYALVTKYGEASSELACQMYEAIAEYSGAKVAAAEAAATASYYETAKSVRGAMMRTRDAATISSSAGRLVKLASVDTMMKNALRDGAEWAWIPSGDTCAYCTMLASRGWTKASEDAIVNGHASHIHNNCDCTYVVRHSKDVTVEGYDPDALYEEYINAGNTKWERINALRRKKYAANKDYINAQKRAAYARRKSIDNGGGSGYNNPPAKKTILELENTYEKAVNEGWISPLCGRDNYIEQYNRMYDEVIGITTRDGQKVESMTDHFMERLIGTGRDPKEYAENHRIVRRSGVSVDDVKEALLNGEVRNPVVDPETGLRSQKYKGENAIVTINPDTHRLIQCNPRKKKK